MAAASSRANWADDDEFDDPNALPQQQIISNPDGTKTIITYRFNDAGKKVKTTRRIKTIIKKEAVNPRVAERREWVKFGSEKGHGPGPDLSTTSVGENIIFRPQVNWTAKVAEENKEEDALKSQLKDKKVACRICKGDHFTARCPFKDTMPPLDDTAEGAAGEGGTGSGGDGPGGLGDIKGAYVAPHLRGKRGPGESMAGTGSNRFERDDLATLRVTNVSEFADEQDLRDMFGRFGHVTRVFLAKDRDTGRAKGFAFVSFADRTDAARACEKMDGFGYGNLILNVEFAKRAT